MEPKAAADAVIALVVGLIFMEFSSAFGVPSTPTIFRLDSDPRKVCKFTPDSYTYLVAAYMRYCGACACVTAFVVKWCQNLPITVKRRLAYTASTLSGFAYMFAVILFPMISRIKLGKFECWGFKIYIGIGLGFLMEIGFGLVVAYLCYRFSHSDSQSTSTPETALAAPNTSHLDNQSSFASETAPIAPTMSNPDNQPSSAPEVASTAPASSYLGNQSSSTPETALTSSYFGNQSSSAHETILTIPSSLLTSICEIALTSPTSPVHV